MTNRQMTLPGMKKNPDGTIEHGSIKIDLDDQTGDRGLPINQRLYEHLVNRFIQQGEHLRPTEKQFYLINNQLLQVLLSSKGCTGLLLSKCCRDDGKESIAFIALGEDNTPLHWQLPGQAAEESTTAADVASGEWIQGLTVDDIRKSFLREGIVPEINFDRLFNRLKAL